MWVNYSHPRGTSTVVSASSPGARDDVVAVLCRVSSTALLGRSALFSCEAILTMEKVFDRNP